LGGQFKTASFQRTTFLKPHFFLGTDFSNNPFSKKMKNKMCRTHLVCMRRCDLGDNLSLYYVENLAGKE
jgi:hypothetical protein